MNDRYEHFAMRQVWTTTSKLQRWLRAEQAIATAGDYGELAHALGLAIEVYPTSAAYRTSLQQAEERTGHDVAAFVEVTEQRLAAVGCSQSRFLHYGATSSDVVDTGWALAHLAARKVLSYELSGLNQALGLHSENQTAGSWRQVRTHGQVAALAPIRNLVNSWFYEAARATEAHSLCPPVPGRIAGPAGDRPILSAERERAGLEYVGLVPDMQGTQIVSRDRLVEWLQALARISTACAKIATSIRFELIEGVDGAQLQRGEQEISSSSMPHKSASDRPGPAAAERICGLAALVRNLVAAVEQVQISWGDHTLEHSSVERIAVPQVAELTAFSIAETRKIVERVSWNNHDRPRHPDPKTESFQIMHRLIDQGASRAKAMQLARDGVTDYYDVSEAKNDE